MNYEKILKFMQEIIAVNERMKSFFICSEKQFKIFDLTILINELKLTLKTKSAKIAEIIKENKS
jgi:hypothetical protein